MRKNKKLFNLYITEKRIDDLKYLSQELDVPMSILIRMGITKICQKYEKVLKLRKQENGKPSD